MSGIIFAIASAILPACAYEDSPNCFWDASARGNGLGKSYAAISLPDGEILFFEDGSYLHLPEPL